MNGPAIRRTFFHLLMKRILSLSVLSVLLAACSTPSDIPHDSGSPSIPGPSTPAADGPLVVPPQKN